MKFVDMTQCITAGEPIVVYEWDAFQQSAPAIFWGNISGCYEDLQY